MSNAVTPSTPAAPTSAPASTRAAPSVSCLRMSAAEWDAVAAAARRGRAAPPLGSSAACFHGKCDEDRGGGWVRGVDDASAVRVGESVRSQSHQSALLGADPRRVCLCEARANGRNQRRQEAQQRSARDKHGRGAAWRHQHGQYHSTPTPTRRLSRRVCPGAREGQAHDAGLVWAESSCKAATVYP
eukprot:362608-Chlamydomonas_euryale.AAC.4